MNDQIRILVVEDEPIVAADLKMRLELLGYQVTGTAACSNKALVQAEQLRPDLVLMDIRLDNSDGIDAAQQIRRKWHLPVIFLTAYADNSTLERAKLVEPSGYILKPFDDRELKTTIAMALYKYKTDTEIRRLNRLYASLSQINQAIVRIRTRGELFQVICCLMVQYGEFKIAWISTLDPQTNKLLTAAWWSAENSDPGQIAAGVVENREGYSPAAAAVLEKQPIIINNVSGCSWENPWHKTAAAAGMKAIAAFPIRIRDVVSGALTVCSDEVDFFQEQETRLLKEVVWDIAFALDNQENEILRRQAENALKASEEKFRGLFETMVEGVAMHEVLYDATGAPVDYRITDINPAYTQITGISRENALGKKASELYTTGTPPYLEIYGKVAATGKPEQFETYFAPMAKHFRISVFSPGKGLFDTVFEDITARKQADEQIQSQVVELQRWYNVTLGRENRVLELKHEVNELLSRLHEPHRYTE